MGIDSRAIRPIETLSIFKAHSLIAQPPFILVQIPSLPNALVPSSEQTCPSYVSEQAALHTPFTHKPEVQSVPREHPELLGLPQT